MPPPQWRVAPHCVEKEKPYASCYWKVSPPLMQHVSRTKPYLSCRPRCFKRLSSRAMASVSEKPSR